eukprot:3640220-Amphidinium_carterae.1
MRDRVQKNVSSNGVFCDLRSSVFSQEVLGRWRWWYNSSFVELLIILRITYRWNLSQSPNARHGFGKPLRLSAKVSLKGPKLCAKCVPRLKTTGL